MALHIDRQYAGLIGPQLDNFTQKGDLISFRCPYCGDSQKSTKKKRGNLFPVSDSLVYHCYNCGISTGFSQFLKFVDSFNLYDEYRKDVYLYENSFKTKRTLKREQSKNSHISTGKKNCGIFSELKEISDILFYDQNHPSTQYLLKRKFTKEMMEGIYWADNFLEFHNKHSRNQIEGKIFEDGRIIFPIISKNGVEYGFQGRDIKNSEIRYLTSIFNKNYTKQYGMDKINEKEEIFVLEGAIDSRFFDNAIAALDGSLHTVSDELELKKSNTFLIHDNEPRNKEIMSIMNRSIENGWRVCFWPREFKGIKDINDLVIERGFSPKKLKEIFLKNSVFGMEAKMKFISYNKT